MTFEFTNSIQRTYDAKPFFEANGQNSSTVTTYSGDFRVSRNKLIFTCTRRTTNDKKSQNRPFADKEFTGIATTDTIQIKEAPEYFFGILKR